MYALQQIILDVLALDGSLRFAVNFHAVGMPQLEIGAQVPLRLTCEESGSDICDVVPNHWLELIIHCPVIMKGNHVI